MAAFQEYFDIDALFLSVGATEFKRLLGDESLSDAAAKANQVAVDELAAANSFTWSYLSRRFGTITDTTALHMVGRVVKTVWLFNVATSLRKDIQTEQYREAYDIAVEWITGLRDGQLDLPIPPQHDHEVLVEPAVVDLGENVAAADDNAPISSQGWFDQL